MTSHRYRNRLIIWIKTHKKRCLKQVLISLIGVQFYARVDWLQSGEFMNEVEELRKSIQATGRHGTRYDNQDEVE